MNENQSDTNARPRRNFALAVFGVALVFHVYFVTYNWSWGILLGHEFRQTQTAIITEYIDRQDNFSYYYETPILGKPWAFPLEFPFYQWAVVGVKRGLDLTYHEAARTVSITSFYLALPALYLLLGSLGVAGGHRWWVLAMALVCPVHIFYSRSFLIDPMAMMLSAWFLTAFVRAMDTRRWGWWGLAVATAIGGILIKSVIFAVWLFPAALYGAWNLRKTWREGAGWQKALGTVAWGVSAVAPALGLLHLWIGYTDAIKAVHRSAWIFTSKALAVGNFGTFNLSARLHPQTWSSMAERWREAIMEPWILLVILGAGAALCRPERKFIVGAFLVWMFGQLAFPQAYAGHDYYFYAGALFLMMALGFVVAGVWNQPRWPGWLRVALVAIPFLFLGQNYLGGYYQLQKVKSQGGSGLTAVLRDMLPADSVVAVIGHDWASLIPHYAQRRALMVRRDLETDFAYLEGAAQDLADEQLAALVINGEMRHKQSVVATVTRILGMMPVPLFRHRDEDVYVSPVLYHVMRGRLAPGKHTYDQVERLAAADPEEINRYQFQMTPGMAQLAFPMVQPAPFQYRIAFGYAYNQKQGFIEYHPSSDIWLRPTQRQGQVRWSYGLKDFAWQRSGDKSDGVDFVVFAEAESGERRELFRDEVTPAEDEADRGEQTGGFAYELREGEIMVFSSRGHGHTGYDWAYLTQIAVE